MEMRDKTLLKSYLEVDMNEYFQQQIDSKLFEGLEESEKAQFVGNFFHWVKCRFSDCGSLAQKSSHKAEKKEEAKPKATEKKVEKPVEKAAEKPADEKLIQTDAQIKTAAEKKDRFTTNTSKAVAAELAKESHDREMKQADVGADSNKDSAPE